MSFRLARAAGFAPLLLVHGRVFPNVHWYDYLFDFIFFYDKSVDTEVWEYDTDKERKLVEDGAVTVPEAFAELSVVCAVSKAFAVDVGGRQLHNLH